MTTGSTEEVFGHHVDTLMAQDVDGVMEDFADDSIVIGPDATF